MSDLPRSSAALRAMLQSLAGVTSIVASPPGGGPPMSERFKVAGKMFAILSHRADAWVILKCDPHLAETQREQYAGVGHRSHLDARFWISVELEADVPPAEVDRLVAHSYDLVRAGLTRKQQAEISARS